MWDKEGGGRPILGDVSMLTAKAAEPLPLEVKMAAVGNSRLGGGPDQGELRRQLGLLNVHPLQGAAPIALRTAQVQEVSPGGP